MVCALFTTFVLSFLFSNTAVAFDDLQNKWTLDLLYHYTRLERTTVLATDNIQARTGLMVQAEYEEQIDIFWRWYVGGDLTYAAYEASPVTNFQPRDQVPWQLYAGTGWQFGTLKNFEIFLGVGGSSEAFLILTSANAFTFYQRLSARGHIGFSWRFLSIVGSSATFLAKYSRPFSEVNHNGTPLNYAGILDGTIRLRGIYNSGWSLYGGIRFEDYKTTDRSVSYFTTRVYAGLGLHF